MPTNSLTQQGYITHTVVVHCCLSVDNKLSSLATAIWFLAVGELLHCNHIYVVPYVGDNCLFLIEFVAFVADPATPDRNHYALIFLIKPQFSYGIFTIYFFQLSCIMKNYIGKYRHIVFPKDYNSVIISHNFLWFLYYWTLLHGF